MPRKAKEQYTIKVELELTFDSHLTYGQVRARFSDLSRADLTTALRELLTYEGSIQWHVLQKQLEKRTVY